MYREHNILMEQLQQCRSTTVTAHALGTQTLISGVPYCQFPSNQSISLKQGWDEVTSLDLMKQRDIGPQVSVSVEKPGKRFPIIRMPEKVHATFK